MQLKLLVFVVMLFDNGLFAAITINNIKMETTGKPGSEKVGQSKGFTVSTSSEYPQIRPERSYYLSLPEAQIIKNFTISKHVSYLCHFNYMPIDIVIKDRENLVETTAFLDPRSVELHVEQTLSDVCRKIRR
jgi:hypothetical protein